MRVFGKNFQIKNWNYSNHQLYLSCLSRIGINFQHDAMAFIDDKRPEFMLEDKSKNLIVQEIQKITGDSNNFIVWWHFEKQIRYSIKSEFINNSEENCINIEFDNFNYKDLTITEAVVCDLNGVERIIKLSFIKGQIQDI